MLYFTLYYADCLGNPQNCYYPHKVDVKINDTASLVEAVSHDYVCAQFKDNRRGNDNFISACAICFDCDNTHSDDPKSWLNDEDIANIFKDVIFAVHYSRNHMKEKDGKAPRPKFHVIFLIKVVYYAQVYSQLAKCVLEICPFFDQDVKDPGRMFFGTQNPMVKFHKGSITLDEFIRTKGFVFDIEAGNFTNNSSIVTCNKSYSYPVATIPEGQRNSTLHSFACKTLKLLGETDEARNNFIMKSEQCSPRLPQNEVEQIWKNALNFYRNIVLKDSKYIPPDVFNSGYISLEPQDLTDVGQAQIFAEEYRDMLRYCPAMGFIKFNCVLWEESDEEARSLVHEFTERQLEQAEKRENDAENTIAMLKDMFKQVNVDVTATQPQFLKKYEAEYEKAHRFNKFALKCRDSYRVSATLTEAKPKLCIRVDELDANPFLLNTKSGTYDLRCGLSNSHAHDQGDFITKCTATAPSYKGMDIWLKFLQTIFLNDEELINYVQLIAGLAAIGHVFLEAVIICIGTGCNGKSTLWNAIKRVMGSYGGTISSDVLTANCRRNIKPELADLRGKRLIVASELEEGTTLSTSALKQLASTDTIRAERKYKDPFEFTPSHTTILLTNYLPEIPSGVHSKGTWRRLIVVPFNAQIELGQDVKNYADILFEQSGEAILSWIIEGAQKIINKNYHLDTPEAVLKATDVYKENNDWLQNFMNERCEIGENLTVKAGEFLAAYKDYCTYTGETNKKAGVINAALEAAGYKRQKTRSGVVIKGLRLR